MMLEKLNVKTLTKVAKAYGVKYSQLNKAELVESLQEVLHMQDIEEYTKYNKIKTDMFDIPRKFVSFKPFAEKEDMVNYTLPGFSATVKGLVSYPINFEYKNCFNGLHFDLVEADYCSDYVVPFNITESAKVFILFNKKDFEVLNIICDGDLNNITNYFDGLLVTSAYSGYYDQFVVFNTNIMTDVHQDFDICEMNDSIKENIEDTKEYYMRDKSKAKRRMYTIYKINASHLVYNNDKGYYELPAGYNLESCEIRTGESRMLRQYEHQMSRKIKGTDDEKIVYCADRFIIVSTNDLHQSMSIELRQQGYSYEEAEEVTRAEILKMFQCGIYMNNFGNESLFKVAIQSSSQSRKGKYFFGDFGSTFEEMNKFRDEMLWGALDQLAKKGNIAKINKYIPLCSSTTKEVGSGFTFAVINDIDVTLNSKDHYVNVDINAIKGGVGVSADDVKITPCDGGGFITPQAMAKVNYQLGIISHVDLDYFLAHFNTIEDVRYTTDKKLKRIFDTLTVCIQIRHAGDKGLLTMYDHNVLYGYTVDIVLTDSMRKYFPVTATSEQIPLEVANWSKAKKKYAYTNYQFLASLRLGKNDLVTLADDFLSKIAGEEASITTSVDHALQFLGLIGNIGDEETDISESLVSKLTKILTLCPEMLRDEYVQTKLRELLRNKLEDVSYGRIPIEGSFKYIISDPRFAFGEPIENCISDGYVYSNGDHGEDDEVLLQRSPLIDRSESIIRKTCVISEFWYLKDIIIFSPNDSGMQAMGGADQDGDTALETRNKILLQGAKREIALPFVYDKGKNTLPKEYTEANLLKYFFMTSKVDQVGKLTNLATCHRDYALNDMIVKDKTDDNGYQAKIVRLRFLQGWEIDAPKYDERVTIPDDLREFIKWPHWFAKLKRKEVSDTVEIYHSNSPIGRLFDYMQGIHGIEGLEDRKGYIEAFFEKETKCDFINMLSKIVKLINIDEFKKYLPEVKAIEDCYRHEMHSLREKLADLTVEEREEERKKQIGMIIDDYTEILKNACPDEEIAAAIAFDVCYGDNNGSHKSGSKSFVWSCAWNGMEKLLSRMDEAIRLVKLPRNDNPVETVRVANGLLYINDIYVPVLLKYVEDGIYNPVCIDDRYYIRTKLHGYNIIAREVRIREINAKLKSGKTITIEEAKFIGMSKEEIGPKVEKGLVIVKADRALNARKINGFNYHGINAIEFVETVKNNKNIVDVVLNKDNNVRIVIGNTVLAGVAKNENKNWAHFVGKRLLIETLENPIQKVNKPNKFTQWIDESNKLAYRNTMVIKFYVIGDAPAVEGDLVNDNITTSISYGQDEEYINSYMSQIDEEYIDMSAYSDEYMDYEFIDSQVANMEIISIDEAEPITISYDKEALYSEEDVMLSYSNFDEIPQEEPSDVCTIIL